MRAAAFRLPESIPVVSVALAGVLCTVLVFQWMRSWEDEMVNLNFHTQAEATANIMERQLNGAHGDLLLLREMFEQRNGDVSREEFRLFTASLLKRAPFIQGFALHRVVLDRDRARFEQERSRTMPGYRIRHQVDGEPKVAERRAQYRVIDYIEPLDYFHSSLGQDAHVLAPTVVATRKAQTSGEPVVTSLLLLPYIHARGFLIFMPLYYTGAMPAGWQRDQAYGYAVAIFAVAASMRKILSLAEVAPHLEVTLFGRDERDWVPAFATPPARHARNNQESLLGQLYDSSDLRYEKEFRLLNSPWRLAMSAPRASHWEEHIGSMLVLLVGLVLTAGLSVYAWALRFGKQRVAALVTQRTLELNQANELLRQDVSRREGHSRILHLMASGVALVLIMDEIVRFIQGQLSQRFRCMVLLADATVRAPSLTQELIAALVDDVEVRSRAMLGEQRWKPEQSEPATPFRQALERMNLRALVTRPILDRNGNHLGALLIIGGEADRLNASDEDLLRASADLLGIAIESRRAEEHVRQLALNDELTGLPNRLSFSQQLQRAIGKAERGAGAAAVMFLDLDRFKHINDHFGHDAGDEVLRMVSTGLRSCLREHDVLARIGGDEFMLLVEQFEGTHQLSEIAQRLLEEAARPFTLSGQSCQLGVSIGIAVWPEDGIEPLTLMKNADAAMYRAKALGRNAFHFFSAEMSADSVQRLALESGLRRAIDGREIVVYYQPKLDVSTGNLVGLEALVRWQHMEKGLILPAAFVPFAEETGLISTIGMQVLQIACEDLLRLRHGGLDCGRVAINLSAVQFNDEHLLHKVQTVLNQVGLDPSLLEIELTESMVMQNPQRAIRMMHGLRELGIALSIDDFGTGYSSLASLKRLPVDRIKVDRSFIEDATRDEQAGAIFEAIVAMGHILGMKVVAEGVETLAQLDLLEKVGCDEYQGYLYSEPLPLEHLLDRLFRSDRLDAARALSNPAAA